MKIAIAQIKPVKGDVAANVERHLQFIEQTCLEKADAIFFPELSLTGYEPALASGLATTPDDARLDCFQQISNLHQIVIGIGIPIKTQSGIVIGMVIFEPAGTRYTYAKQQLHSDELPYFEKGNGQVMITVGQKKIAPAICYESLQPDHSEIAFQLGANIYLASVAKSQAGVRKAWTHYPEISVRYAMPVLMANSVGYCDNFVSAGQSAVWSDQGHLLGELDDSSEGILVFDTETEEIWIHVFE